MRLEKLETRGKGSQLTPTLTACAPLSTGLRSPLCALCAILALPLPEGFVRLVCFCSAQDVLLVISLPLQSQVRSRPAGPNYLFSLPSACALSSLRKIPYTYIYGTGRWATTQGPRYLVIYRQLCRRRAVAQWRWVSSSACCQRASAQEAIVRVFPFVFCTQIAMTVLACTRACTFYCCLLRLPRPPSYVCLCVHG